MNKLEKAISIIVQDIKEDLDGYYSDWDIENWKDYLDATGRDSKDVKEDVRYLLNTYSNDNDVDLFLNDYYELELENGEFITYRKFIALVRKEVFKKI